MSATTEPAPGSPPGPGLFRSAALDRMASPDQLNMAAAIVRPGAWLLLLIGAIMLVTGIVASVFITVPVKINAEGILLSPAGVRDVTAVTGGQLRSLNVRLGDHVVIGQPVAKLEQPDLSQEIDQAQAELRDSQDQLQKTTDFQLRSTATQDAFREQQKKNLDASIAFTNQRIGWLQERLKGQQELSEKGFVAKQAVLQTRVELGQAYEEQSRNQNARKQLEVEENAQRTERDRETMGLQLKLASAQRHVEMLGSRMSRIDVVTSPYDGIVAELKVNEGELVERGGALMTLIPADAPGVNIPGSGRRGPPIPLVATLYVQPTEGKRVRPGMHVEVLPSTAKREEFGFIVGRVISVSEVPSTQEGMNRALKNKQMVSTLAASGAPFEVRAELEIDPDTPSGFKWSSSHGPEGTLSGGSPCKAEIVARSETIMELLIPAVKRVVSPLPMSKAPAPAIPKTAARRRVPTVLQQEAVECGAACLGMVLAYHGRWVALEELREQCDVGRDGTKASNMVKAARKLGMTAKGVKREVETLTTLPMPLIVFWNFNHFIVVEGMDLRGRDGKIWINDPVMGNRVVNRREFSDAFTGVALAFEPGPDFARQGSREGLIGILRRRVAGYMLPLSAAMLSGVLLLVPGVVAASFGRVFIDGVLIDGHTRWLEPLLVAMVVMAGLRAMLQYLQATTLARTQIAMATTLSARQMWTVLHLPLGFFSQRYAGDIANRFAMVDRLAGLMSTGMMPALIGLVSLIGYGAVLFVLDPVLGAVTAAAALSAMLVLSLSARGMENANRRMVSDESRLQSVTVQGIAMADDFRASGTEGMFIGRWAGAQARVLDAEQKSTLRTTVLSQTSSLAVALGGVAVVIVGGLRVMDGVITIGILLAFQMLMGSFSGPVLSLVGVGGQMQQLRGLAERLDDVMRYGQNRAKPPTAPPGTVIPQTGGIGIRLHDISFGYAALEPPFISGLDLEIKPGARIALVGGSGSGKSTLGKLMVGLLQPTEGAVELGGVDIRYWPEPDLRRAIAYVDQNVGLFEGAVRDNVSLWDTTMPEERIVAAAQDARAHGFITARPGGYAAPLSEGGSNMSGGERQRLAVARALAINPAVLVLDEATSALDPEVELAIMDAVRRKGCACVIIAHRLSTIRDCDTIVVLRHGQVSEMGNHAELMAQNGEYRQLVEH